MINLLPTLLLRMVSGTVAFLLICGNFLVLCGKMPKDAEDVEVGELCRSALLHPVRCPGIKWNNNYPPSPQSNDEGMKEQNMHHFGIIEMGGGVVQMFHLYCPRLQHF